MTKKETIQVLQSIEDRAVDFPYMTACDWVAIAAAKRHLENSLEVKWVDLEKELEKYTTNNYWALEGNSESPYLVEKDDMLKIVKHFYELGLKAKGD